MLTDAAIDINLAIRLGVESTDKGLVFPYKNLAGDIVRIVRPDNPGVDEPKYKWPAGQNLQLNVLSHGESYLIVEGTKQALAAESNKPAYYGVIGISGCWGWSRNGLGNPDLEICRGKSVFICLDADASTNSNVFDAGEGLREALQLKKANVKFVRLPGKGKLGLDDVLASEDTQPNRKQLLLDLLDAAKSSISERRPRALPNDIKTDTDSRPFVFVNEDTKIVIENLLDAMKKKWEGKKLFNYGGVLSFLYSNSIKVVNKDLLVSLLADCSRCVTKSANGAVASAMPSYQIMGALLERTEEFSELTRISQMPFLREDGTICSQRGYDAATTTFQLNTHLSVDKTLSIEESVRILLDDWLGDFPFETEADRANALALVLTPFIRGFVPLVPLAVVDGLQMGVGKNLLADCVSILMTGKAANTLPYINNEDELKKLITSAFRQASNIFVFDEAHNINSTSFSRAITSISYSDRILGSSTIAEFPNKVTWMSLGNQVKVSGDMARRIYRIGLHPTTADPHMRSSASFRHENIRQWTIDNRERLVSAALCLITSWYKGGEKRASTSFGSFEAWESIVSGILSNCGVRGFLENQEEWRSETDFDRQHWIQHFMWLSDTFGSKEFTSHDVAKELRNQDAPEMPPGRLDRSADNFARSLGAAYSSNKNKIIDGYKLVKCGINRTKTIVWRIEGAGSAGSAGILASSTYEKNSFIKNKEVYRIEPGTIPALPALPAESPETIKDNDGKEADLGPIMQTLLDNLHILRPRCDDCGTEESTIPPSHFIWACKSCFPDTFVQTPLVGRGNPHSLVDWGKYEDTSE